MMTVNEVSKLTGVSIRALQYYDKIGLLHPAEYTEAGYRLYDNTTLERLQQILLFRELEFSLKEIQSILQSPDFDRDRALDQQICLLTLKKEHIENLITFARGLKQIGGTNMDFSAFDTAKMDEYATKAKEKWPLQLVLRNLLIQNQTDDLTSGVAAADKFSVSETIKYATIIVSTLPILCLYPFLQKYFLKGVMVGSVKG